MANNDAAFGMRPTRMIGGAPYTGAQSRYRIAANYGTSIFQGDMVAQVTGGGVEVHADGGTVASRAFAVRLLPAEIRAGHQPAYRPAA